MKRTHEEDARAPRSPLKPSNGLPTHLLKKPRLGLSKAFAPPLQKKIIEKSENESSTPRPEGETIEKNFFQSSRASPEICLCVELLNSSTKAPESPPTFGLLVIHFDELTLFNMEGKSISKLVDVPREERLTDADTEVIATKLYVDGEECPLAFLVKKKRLFFYPGNTVVFNSKTITIRYRVPVEDFKSGAFFLRGVKEIDKTSKEMEKAVHAGPRTFHMAAAVKEVKTFKTFAPPKKADGSSSGLNLLQKRTEPLHNPHLPNAVVLFHPKDLFSLNKIAVVVDPKLAKALRPHQVEGVRFMFECIMGLRSFTGNGCILADDMGLGKTLQAITLIWTLLTQSPTGSPAVRRCVIVTPSSLVGNWVQEFKKWLPDELDPIPMGDADKSKVNSALARFQSKIGGLRDAILVVSYDQLRIHIEEIKNIPNIDLVVCDEGHRLKNANIKTSLAVNELETKRRLILSGTPIQNDLEEFYAMVNFVNPGILGTSTTFRRVYAEHIEAMRQPDCPPDLKAVGRERAIKLSQMTSEFILRRTSKVNQQYLPPKVDALIFCKLTDLQRRLYLHISEGIKKSTLSVSDNGRREASALAGITTLKKLCNAPHLIAKHELELIRSLDDAKVFKPDKYQPELSGKLQFIDLLATAIKRSTNDKMVIVSNYTQTLNVLAMMCRARGFAFFQLDGKTKVSRRQELVNEFNDPKRPEFIFLLSSKAGGVGLNLIGANHLVLVDPDWNPANDLQAMARVWRPGQKKKVYLYRTLATGTIEEKIFQRQVSKLSLASNVVGGNTDAKPDFTANEIRELFNYRAETLSDTHDLLNCRCSRVTTKIPMHKRVAANVDELANWRHVSQFDKLTDYPTLQACSESLTFVFLKDDEDKQEEEATSQVHIQQVEVNFDIGDGTQDRPIGEEMIIEAHELDDDSLDGPHGLLERERMNRVSEKEVDEIGDEEVARETPLKEKKASKSAPQKSRKTATPISKTRIFGSQRGVAPIATPKKPVPDKTSAKTIDVFPPSDVEDLEGEAIEVDHSSDDFAPAKKPSLSRSHSLSSQASGTSANKGHSTSTPVVIDLVD